MNSTIGFIETEQKSIIFLDMEKNFKIDNQSEKIVIAIDGCSASGKGTLAKYLAKKYNLYHCETGFYFRALAYILEKNKIEFSNLEKISSIINNIDILESVAKSEIYNDKISSITSRLAEQREIRILLESLQKNIIKKHKRIVLDGRDIGTTIAPDAEFKFFLDCDIEQRAIRRFEQLSKHNPNCTIEEIKISLLERDKRDSQRDYSPLLIPKDSHYIDTSNISLEDLFEKIDNILLFGNWHMGIGY